MKRLLVPTDFSERALNATQVAIELASQINAEIDFLHFTSIPIDWNYLNNDDTSLHPDIDKKIKSCDAELNELIALASKSNVHARSFIGYSENYENIIQHVAKYDNDLIIMGSHGAAGFRAFLIGSNAQRVIRISKVPVLVIKQTTKIFDIEKLVIVSDFDNSEVSKMAYVNGLKELAAVADQVDLSLSFLYINTPDLFYSAKMVSDRMKTYEELIQHNVKEKAVINANNLEIGIQDYINKNKNVIIGMVSHGYLSLGRTMSGRKAENIANRIDDPLLCIKMNQSQSKYAIKNQNY